MEAFLSPLPYYAYHQQDNHQNSCTDDDWNKNGQGKLLIAMPLIDAAVRKRIYVPFRPK